MSSRLSDLVQAEKQMLALADQLKTPFTQIAIEAELGDEDSLLKVQLLAKRALKTIESYLLSAELGQTKLLLQPVSLSSVLYDASQKLCQQARDYNCDIELEIAGKYGPVFAHHETLELAIITLGQSLIEAQSTEKKGKIVVSAYKSNRGMMAGVFGANDELSAKSFAQSKTLYGRASQLIPSFSSTSSTGVYIANSLFEAMSSSLKVARHHNLTGLAAKLLPSSQLQLV